MSLEGYNQKLNKIYANPYSHQNHNHSECRRRSPNHMSRSELPISSMNLIGQSNGQTHRDANSLYPRSQLELRVPGAGFGNQRVRLTASDLFKSNDSEQEKKPIVRQQTKPGINYFVNEFERLQQQNKMLKKKIQQREGLSPQKSNNQVKKLDINVVAQNAQLRRQLEQQRRKNSQKNDQINQLLSKINQIQGHVEAITKSKQTEIANLVKQQKTKQSYNQIEKQKQKQQQLRNLKIQYSQMFSTNFNPLLQRIKILQSQLNQLTTQYQQLQKKISNPIPLLQTNK